MLTHDVVCLQCATSTVVNSSANGPMVRCFGGAIAAAVTTSIFMMVLQRVH